MITKSDIEEFFDNLSRVDAMVQLMFAFVVIIWALAFLGCLLPFFGAGAAINMGLGCFIAGIPVTFFFITMFRMECDDLEPRKPERDPNKWYDKDGREI